MMGKEIFIYYGSILLSAIFAGLAQKFAKRDENKNIVKLNKFFWTGSFLILFIIMGFRECGVGVDDKTYSRIFYLTAEKGFIAQFLDTTMEPGYLLINYIVSCFTTDFQAILIITTIVPLILYYKAFEYEKNNINLFLGIFLFGSIMYVYFFGIIRLFIAASICSFAIRYLIEKKPTKYGILIFIAMLFHYSSFIMMFLIFLAMEKENKKISIKKMVIFLVVVIPLIVIIVFNYIFPNMGNRYSGYVIKDSTLRIGLDKIAILILAMILYKHTNNFNDRIRIYIILYAVSTIISIYNTWFDIGRMQWYSIFAVCIILPTFLKTMKKMKMVELNLFIVPTIIAYGIFYSYRIVFLQITNECMRNYSNILFK